MAIPLPTPTNNPVPSSDIRDHVFAGAKLDEAVTSKGFTYTDRLGQQHLTIDGIKHRADQAISAFGYITMDSFQAGATLKLPNQVLRDTSTGEYYRWDGVFDKVVPAGSTPATTGGVATGAWVSVGDASLRANLGSGEDGMGGSLVRLKGGETVQGFVNSIELYASDYGFTGVGDETEKWKLFCQEPRSKVADKTIYISGEGLLADDTNLRFIHGAGVILTADVTATTASGSESHCLVAGKNSIIRDAWFSGVDGQFYNGAGILVSETSGVQLINCRSYFTSGIPVKFYKSQNCKAIWCWGISARHGGMGWLCDNIEVVACFVNRMSHPTLNAGGGWWFAACTNVKVHDCIISDCTDVGVDFEGGNKCESYNNTLIRCRNGELAVFATGTETELQSAGIVMGHITHRDNTVYRYSYCYDRSGNQVSNALTDTAGEMVFGGLDLVQDGPITFERNKVYVVDSTGNSLYCHRSRTSNASGTAKIIQSGCEYETRSGKTILFYDRQDRELNHCKLKYVGSAAVITFGELRDLRSFKSSGLDVDVDLSATVSGYVLVINNSQAVSNVKLELDSWKLRGPDGAVLLRIDQTFTPRTVILNNMDLPDFIGTDPAKWPVTIGAGKIYWKNQKLRILNTSGGALSFATGILYQSDFDAINCHTTLMLASKKKSVYRFALKCDASDSMYLAAIDSGGAVNTGLWPNSLCYATFSGNSVSFTNTGSDTLSAVIELNLNSM